MKTEVIHARVQSDVKRESEKIFDAIGLTMSQAVDMFLRQVVLKKGMPFRLDSQRKETNEIEQLAYIISSVGGKEPSPKAKRILRLYVNGDIDLETAKFAITRGYSCDSK